MKSRINPSLLFLVFAGAAHGAALTWDTVPGDGSTITPGSGSWQTDAGNWNAAGTDVNWTAGDTAIFAGADGDYTVTVTGPITTGNSSTTGITFSNSGYTITGGETPRTIALGNSAAAANSPIAVASGKTATIGKNITITKGATGNLGTLDIRGGGTLLVGSGTAGDATFLNTSGSSSHKITGGTTLDVRAGGTFNSSATLVIGSTGTPAETLPNTLRVSGGNVNINSFNLVIGSLPTGQASTGIVDITAGELRIGAAGGILRFGGANSGAATANGTVNLDGGTIITPLVAEGATTGTVSTFNFNGGTLKVLPTSTGLANFMTGLDKAQIRNGGAIIDTDGAFPTIGQALVHSTVGGDSATDGGLTKNGLGTLTLTGANTYTGPTIINGGRLNLNAPYNSITAPVVNSGGRLQVTSGASATSLPSATVNAGGGFAFELGAYNPAHQPSLAVGTLNAAGNYTVDVNWTGSIPANTPITLLTYTSKTGSGTPSIGTLPAGYSLAGPVVDTGSSIQITFAQTLTWSKGDGTWDLVSNNWNGNTVPFVNGSAVAFPTLTDAVDGVNTVTLAAGSLTPSGVGITNTGDFDTSAYSFAGTGGIAGSAGIVKAGTGIVSFSNPNSYTGPLTISAGAVLKKAADTTSGAISVAEGAAFVLSGGVSDGAGQTITLTGPGTVGSGLYFTGSSTQRGALQGQDGSNTWAGNIVLEGGTNTRIGVQNGGSLTLLGNISESTAGTSPFFRSGTASDTITFSGTGSWTGATRLFSDGGVFALGANNGFSTAAELVVASSDSNTVLDLAGFNQTVTGLSGFVGGVVRNSGGGLSTLTTNTPAGTYEFRGLVQDEVSLIFGGTGTTYLGGDNTYSGNTTINAGANLTVNSFGELKFYPQASGVTNSVGGAGSLVFDGTVQIDISAAAPILGNSWTLFNKAGLVVTFGDNLKIISQDGTFTETAPDSGIWTVVDGSNVTWTFTESNGKLTVGTPSADPYASWVDSFFPGVVDPSIIGKSADPDKDGVNNLAEFALHGSPNSGTSSGYQGIAIEDTDSDTLKELTLTIAVRNGSGSPVFSATSSPSATVDGVVYTVQGSLNLVFPSSGITETALPTGLPALPSGWEYRRFRLDASEPLGTKGFIRVETKQAP